MNLRHAAPRSTYPLGRALVGLCSLLLPLLIHANPSLAADVGGSVSYSIRLEVGVADLQSGGIDDQTQEKSGAAIVREKLAPQLRSYLSSKYQPRQVDEIVRAVTNHAVIVVDGEGFTANPSQESWVASEKGAVLSL